MHFHTILETIPGMRKAGDACRSRDFGYALGRQTPLVFAVLLVAYVLLFTGNCLDYFSAYAEVEDASSGNEATAAQEAPTGMVLIPAGEFMMGSPLEEGESDEHPPHSVNVDAFYIDTHEATNGQFKTFVDATKHVTQAERSGGSWTWTGKKWVLQEGADWRHPTGPESTIDDIMNHPVVHVSWDDAVAYAKWAGKRLPTEAEWEKACRAGTTTRYSTGDTITREDANFEGTGGKDVWEQASPVGSFAPNAWGLYDMHGNVWERCSDWYDENYYADSPAHNPKGPTGGQYQVIRGGAWYIYAHALRSPNRYFYGQTFTAQIVGFRCVKDLD